jgi:16S rRNA (cytosine967-C5)-methyltransferase
MSTVLPDAAGAGYATDARTIAWEALETVERRPVYVARALDDLFRARGTSPVDRGLATELAAGVLRRRLTLDAIIAPHVRRPAEQTETGLWRLLQLGVYQLLFLSIPPHAAVYETVELCRRLGQPRWSGFVNGVLRAVQRELTDERVLAPAADAVPLSSEVERQHDGSGEEQVGTPAGPGALVYRRMSRPYFADPDRQPAAYLAGAFSLPPWLAERWLERGGWDQTLPIAGWFLSPGLMCLRVNRLRADRESVLSELAAAGIAALPGELPESIRLVGRARAETLPGFGAGRFSVQDESAQQAVALLEPRPGERVLDLCAAPGGKTTHIAERMENVGRITAVDVDAGRLSRVSAAAERLGLSIIESLLSAADGSDVPHGPFDRILLDVPCSNTGVLGKRPEARWRISRAGMAELTIVQRRLLEAAVARLAATGRVVYSTCSIEPEENGAVVRTVLDDHPELELLQERRHVPGRPADGGYLALIGRR